MADGVCPRCGVKLHNLARGNPKLATEEDVTALVEDKNRLVQENQELRNAILDKVSDIREEADVAQTRGNTVDAEFLRHVADQLSEALEVGP